MDEPSELDYLHFNQSQMTHLHDVPVRHHLRQALGDLRAGRSQQHHHPRRGLCVDGVEEAIHAHSRITLIVGEEMCEETEEQRTPHQR